MHRHPTDPNGRSLALLTVGGDRSRPTSADDVSPTHVTGGTDVAMNKSWQPDAHHFACGLRAGSSILTGPTPRRQLQDVVELSGAINRTGATRAGVPLLKRADLDPRCHRDHLTASRAPDRDHSVSPVLLHAHALAPFTGCWVFSRFVDLRGHPSNSCTIQPIRRSPHRASALFGCRSGLSVSARRGAIRTCARERRRSPNKVRPHDRRTTSQARAWARAQPLSTEPTADRYRAFLNKWPGAVVTSSTSA